MHYLEPYAPLKRALSPQEQDADMKRGQIMDLVRHGLYDFGDMQMLGNRVGRSPSCLHAIRSGRTRWPRWGTLLCLLPHLGLELTIQRIARH